jgi:hypothetical protein
MLCGPRQITPLFGWLGCGATLLADTNPASGAHGRRAAASIEQPLSGDSVVLAQVTWLGCAF